MAPLGPGGALVAAGLVVSRYLAAYQLGYIDYVWDPFFGFDSGTRPVLDSQMSHMWPVSDAGLGTVLYSIEFLMGFMGGKGRWRTMPWMVIMFGIVVIPLGLMSTALCCRSSSSLTTGPIQRRR